MQRSVDSYLQLLHTLMIAYARAGIKPLQGAPAEQKGTASTLLVECPLDVAMRYVWGAAFCLHFIMCFM